MHSQAYRGIPVGLLAAYGGQYLFLVPELPGAPLKCSAADLTGQAQELEKLKIMSIQFTSPERK